MISKTKTVDSFPVGNFLIDGFSSRYRLDRDSTDRSILLYVRKDIPSILLIVEIRPIEDFLCRNKSKWLINCFCNLSQRT